MLKYNLVENLLTDRPGEDKSCGLWFLGDGGSEFKAETIIENKPARIIAMIPNLKGDVYRVKVVTQYTGGGKFIKTPKTFIYPKKLLV